MKEKKPPFACNCPSRCCQERIGIFIDGMNNYTATRSLGFEMDYLKFLKYARSLGLVVRAFYYTPLIDGPATGRLRGKMGWLAYNGYTLVTKQAKEYIDEQGRRRIKGNMDVEMAVNMLELVPHLDHVILLSGASDLCPLVEAVQRGGAHVTVISTERTTTPIVSEALRRIADDYIDLKDLAPLITRTRYATRDEDDIAQDDGYGGGGEVDDDDTPPAVSES
jgi:uncharacterized LabA/DUF88 family protein